MPSSEDIAEKLLSKNEKKQCSIIAQRCECIRLKDHDIKLAHACDCGGSWFGEMEWSADYSAEWSVDYSARSSDDFKVISFPIKEGMRTLEQIEAFDNKE